MLLPLDAHQFREDVAKHPEVERILDGMNCYSSYNGNTHFYKDKIVNYHDGYETFFYKVPGDRKPLTEYEMLSALAVIEHCTNWRALRVDQDFSNHSSFSIKLERKTIESPPKVFSFRRVGLDPVTD
ncbi:MAG: hypothetical protein ACLSDQ_02395 [Adlercreutzia equolifaciens]